MAENLLVQVIETKKTVLGPEHPDTLRKMNNLALTYSGTIEGGRKVVCASGGNKKDSWH
jgi:Tetratricopeptide repeat